MTDVSASSPLRGYSCVKKGAAGPRLHLSLFTGLDAFGPLVDTRYQPFSVMASRQKPALAETWCPTAWLSTMARSETTTRITKPQGRMPVVSSDHASPGAAAVLTRPEFGLGTPIPGGLVAGSLPWLLLLWLSLCVLLLFVCFVLGSFLLLL